MRVLLDENLPHSLVPLIVGHDVLTVQGRGWAGLKNGALLQQHLIGMPFGVAILHARSNRLADLLPVVPLVLAALQDLAPGEVRHIGA